MTEKIYHIYAKNECLYHSLSEAEFNATWNMIHKFLSVAEGKIDVNDLSYEEVIISKEITLNSSY